MYFPYDGTIITNGWLQNRYKIDAFSSCIHIKTRKIHQSATTGTASEGIGHTYPDNVSIVNSLLASCNTFLFINNSIVEHARTFHACTAAFRPILLPAEAVDCQLWPGHPFGHAATWICAVGVSQLTSPTSVEPGRKQSPS